MSAEALEHFRTFITESFTAVAVDIFTEVQGLVQAYGDENKRLRALLDSVLNPEIRLSRIDVSAYTASSLPVVRESSPEVRTRVIPWSLEPQCEQLKEEQMDYVINEGSEQSNEFMVVVKTEPDLPQISGSYSEVEVNIASSATASASASASEDDNDEDYGDEDFYAETEVEEASAVVPKKKSSQQKTILETPRFKKPDKTFLPTPSEYKTFITRLTEAYKDMPEEQRPLITRLGLDKNIEFVDSALGRVPKGSPLSYQYPLASEYDFKPLDDAPPQPGLPLQSQKIDAFVALPTLSTNEQAAISSMKLTWQGAYSMEHSTRTNKETIDELKNRRLINCFKDIFCLKVGQSNAEHLIAKIKRGKRRCKQATIEEELRTEALREYCRLLCVNWYPCGLVVHPGAPWFAALPDGLVYDPNEAISFGLMHVKCPNLRSFTECKFLVCRKGILQLKSNHPSYWHIQGEMMVTGTSWCDLLVYCGEDMLVQRVYRDEGVIKAMKKKMEEFFFYYYLPSFYQ